MKSGAVLPLIPLDDDFTRCHPGSPDAVMGCVDQRDCYPDLKVYAHLLVRFLQIGNEAAG